MQENNDENKDTVISCVAGGNAIANRDIMTGSIIK